MAFLGYDSLILERLFCEIHDLIFLHDYYCYYCHLESVRRRFTMTLIEGLFPPSRENYELLLRYWQIGYPIVSLTSHYLNDENRDSHTNVR